MDSQSASQTVAARGLVRLWDVVFGFLVEEGAESELLCGLLSWEASEKTTEVLSGVDFEGSQWSHKLIIARL